MTTATLNRPVEVLLFEDDPGQVRIAHAILRDADADIWVRISVVHDRDRATALLHGEPPFADAPKPDLVLLDLKHPETDAPAVPADIPIAVLTGARRETDTRLGHVMDRSCRIAEFRDSEDCQDVFRAVRDVWLGLKSMSLA